MEMPLVSFIVNRLGVLLNEFEEAEFLYGVSRQLVERIQSVLALMPSALQGAHHAIQSYYHVDPRVSNWVAEFGKLAYETEDIVETFVIEFSSRRNKRGFRNHLKIFARISKEWNDIQRVGSEIYDIENKLMDLAVSLHSFGLRRRGTRSSTVENQQELRQSDQHVVEEDFVGFEEDLNKVVKHLVQLDDYTPSRVVSILRHGWFGEDHSS